MRFFIFFAHKNMGLLLLCAQAAICVTGLAIGIKAWRSYGILFYIVIATITANMQVLKIVPVDFFGLPTIHMAQGTIVFCSIFWAQDVLTENYGPRFALRGLLLSCAAVVLFNSWMLVTCALPASLFHENLKVNEAMHTLFMPAPRLFAASLIAYFVSQGLDILVLAHLKEKTGGRFLALRSVISTLCATLCDHFLFSWLAFQLFDPKPLPWKLWSEAYLLTGYGLRILLACFSPIALKVGCRMLKKKPEAKNL